MKVKAIYLENNSKHFLEYVGFWENKSNILKGRNKAGLEPGSSHNISPIEVPENSDFNYAWLYVRDPKNMATFELYVRVGKSGNNDDDARIGLLANCSHATSDPTPNPCNKYLDCRINNDSFTFTIKSTWTDNPPSYVFNYGHYALKSVDIAFIHTEVAVHSFIIAQSFNGEETIKFNCYGGAETDPSKQDNLCYPAMTFLGDEYELALAKTICCFDPSDERNVYDAKPIGGRLVLGDCCGIIYLGTGVCHQMTNRICAAFTTIDAGDRADMAGYNGTHLLWGTYGSSIIKDPTPELKMIFHDIINDDLLKQINRLPISYLFYDWDAYFNKCKELVEAAGYKRGKY